MSTQNKNDVIKISNLVKAFGAFKALDGLNLTVQKGEVHGFLGPNGAGKSTTIRLLLGLLQKTGGQMTLFGRDPWADSVALHAWLSYVPGDVSLWPSLSGGEVIDLFGSLRGGIDHKKRQQLLKDFQLDARKKCDAYSKGNRQKVALIAALAADVPLYILDEPTSGLDPLMETVFQHHILELKKAGKTVLLSSHILAEVEALADTVTIIRNGKTVQEGALSQLRHFGRQAIKVRTTQAPAKLKDLAGVHDMQQAADSVTFTVENEDLASVMKYLSGLGIEALSSQPQSLEELFMKHYNTTSSGGK